MSDTFNKAQGAIKLASEIRAMAEDMERKALELREALGAVKDLDDHGIIEGVTREHDKTSMEMRAEDVRLHTDAIIDGVVAFINTLEKPVEEVS